MILSGSPSLNWSSIAEFEATSCSFPGTDRGIPEGAIEDSFSEGGCQVLAGYRQFMARYYLYTFSHKTIPNRKFLIGQATLGVRNGNVETNMTWEELGT